MALAVAAAGKFFATNLVLAKAPSIATTAGFLVSNHHQHPISVAHEPSVLPTPESTGSSITANVDDSAVPRLMGPSGHPASPAMVDLGAAGTQTLADTTPSSMPVDTLDLPSVATAASSTASEAANQAMLPATSGAPLREVHYLCAKGVSAQGVIGIPDLSGPPEFLESTQRMYEPVTTAVTTGASLSTVEALHNEGSDNLAYDLLQLGEDFVEEVASVLRSAQQVFDSLNAPTDHRRA
jgi:hypothetical protein